MKVLVCGEGDHDIGRSTWNARIKEHIYEEGWMQPILRRLTEAELELIPARHAELVLLPRDASRHRPLPPGFGGKALAATFKAKILNASVIIFMTDADSNNPADWREKVREIDYGFEQSPFHISGVACVPMSASECWLLTDNDAWISVSGRNGGFNETVAERIWGDRHDPEGNHPKHAFNRQCENFGVPDNRETRNEIAQHIEISKIAKNCPISYGGFENSARTIL